MANQPTPQQTVAAILKAQYRPLDYAQQRVQAQAAKEQAALQAASQALVAQLQGGVQQAAPVYDAAVNQTTGLAQQAASLLAGANPNSQVQADLTAVGAPLEQQSQLAGQLGSGFGGQGGVLNVMQGSIPGASLVAQKAAEQGFLAGLPTVASLQGQQNLRSLLARSADSRDKYVTDRMSVAGQAASLLPQLRQQLVENQQADRSFGLQQRQVADQERQDRIDAMWTQRKFDADEAYRASQLKADEAAARAQATGDAQDRADANYWKGIAAQQNQQRIGIARQAARATTKRGGSAGLQLRNLPDGSVVGFNPNTGEVTPVKGPNGKSTAGGRKATPEEVRKFAELSYYGKKPTSYTTNAKGKKIPVGGIPGIGYQKALFRLMHTYGLKLNDAQGVLNDYYAPGEDGRPLYNYQERKQLKVTDTGTPAGRKKKVARRSNGTVGPVGKRR